MKIVVFSGTTEGKNLSQTLAAEGAEVIVSVASDYGAEEQGDFRGITVSEGLKDEAGIRELIRGADLVVDATHPYAVLVTENIRRAAEQEEIRRLRLIREQSSLDSIGEIRSANREHGEQRSECPTVTLGGSRVSECYEDAPEYSNPTEGGASGIRLAADAAQAARLAGEIAGASGHILLTTGSKDLKLYAEELDPRQLYARVLPLVQSIELCEQAGIPHRNIIAIQGPFSEELNLAVIRDYEIDVMITKESGKAGGFQEKIRACETAGIPAIVIARPPEDGLSYDEVLTACRKLLEQGER